MTLKEAANKLWHHYFGDIGGVHPYVQSIGVGADSIKVMLVREPMHFEKPIPATWEGWPVESRVVGRVTIGPPE